MSLRHLELLRPILGTVGVTNAVTSDLPSRFSAIEEKLERQHTL